MRKSPKAVKAKITKAVRSGPALAVEYPQEGETISHPWYTFRVKAAAEAGPVEVTIDGGDWQPCREAVGFWWFDWADYTPGMHEVVARFNVAGVPVISEPRHFTVG